MTYVLETITQQDQEKIIKDAECDPLKNRDFVYATRNPRDFPQNWVIDRERNFYMCFRPVLMRPETMGDSLYFYFKEYLYEIRIRSPFSNEVEFVDIPPPFLLNEFQREIVAAFTVFGRSGGGAIDCLGNPDTISPEFKRGV